MKNHGFTTKLVHGHSINDPYKSANIPIYQTSTFAFDNCDMGAQCFSGEADGYMYTRLGNPTIRALEKTIAELENGYDAIATGSGMAAVTTVYMALLGQGAHIVSTDAVYGASRSVMEDHFSRFGVESTYVNTTSKENILKAIKPNTKVLYIESPANPTMEISDLKMCADIAKEHNLIMVVDNTFCSPYLQKPLDLGADVVLHSMTKYINGHADIVGGIIITKNKEIDSKIRPLMINMGGCIDPHQAYLVLRGLKTLSLRMERSQENAIKIAEYLESNPKVDRVMYPGLKSHPQYELAKRQMNGPGAMISFEMKGGIEAGKRLLDNLKVAILAVSLGGVETLVEHPASMTHTKVRKEERLKAGITDGLVRLSVGIEDVNDLLDDLKQAFEKV
jgi:methionine-gamma-lyase